MVNAKNAFLQAVKILQQAKIEEALHDARLLFEYSTNLDARLLTETQEIEELTEKRLYTSCIIRATNYPLQYILGKWWFMDLELKIGEGVLIPRADTECVCEAAIEKCKNITNAAVLDLCSGSGAIALGIKSFVPTASVTAVELYDDAIKYLKLNGEDKIEIIKCDVFDYQTQISNSTFDVIVANPPYIAADEMCTLAAELNFEPQNALTDRGDGLKFYKHIAEHYKQKLKQGGWLIFEIGSTQANDVSNILSKNSFKLIEVLKDYGGNDRVVLAQN